MKPRKSWEPAYRFGGDRGAYCIPRELGTTNGLAPPKKFKLKRKKK